LDSTLVALFALGYSGLVLFWLAHALRKLYPAMRAALMAFGISAGVHAVTMLFVPAEHVTQALFFWAVPHVLLLPLLLWTAKRHGDRL
jgi:uncharacterized membrane protein